MGSVYTPGQYDVVELKNRLDAIEYGLTQRVLESGPITSVDEQQDWTGKVMEASFGKNTVLWDDLGYPSVMVKIGAFQTKEVLDGAADGLHPAFIVRGTVKPYVYIGKYSASMVGSGENARYVSLKGMSVARGLVFDQARQACEAKGPGWHTMTNSERAAVALWCRKNNCLPQGNNDYGKDITETEYIAAPITTITTGKIGYTAAGTGPLTWTHDGTPFGIYDLNGNIPEWVDGMKLVDGKIYIHPNNNFNTGNTEGSVEGWVDTGLYFDSSVEGSSTTESTQLDGVPILSSSRTKPMHTGNTSSNEAYQYCSDTFENLTASEGVEIPEILKALALFPADSNSHGTDKIYVRNYGERVASWGGLYTAKSEGGVFCLYLNIPRNFTTTPRGFRLAYIDM